MLATPGRSVSPSRAGLRRPGPRGRPLRSRAIAWIKGKRTRKAIQPRAFALDRRGRRGDTPCHARRAALARGSEIQPRAFALDRRGRRGDTPCHARRVAPAPGSGINTRAFALDRRTRALAPHAKRTSPGPPYGPAAHGLPVGAVRGGGWPGWGVLGGSWPGGRGRCRPPPHPSCRGLGRAPCPTGR
jgi:hypothetical protein